MANIYRSAAMQAAMMASVPPEDILSEAHESADDILDAVSQALEEEDMDLWIQCADKVYTVLFAAGGGLIPTTTDVIEAAARCVSYDIVKDMLARAPDAPACLRDWITFVPGLRFVDSDGGDVNGHRLAQLVNAVWASEAPDGYRYWPNDTDISSIDVVVDLFLDHYRADLDEATKLLVKDALDDTYLGDQILDTM